MKQTIFTFILVASSFKVEANCPAVDPCIPGNHDILNDASRSTSSTFDEGATDYDLPINWYVSVSGAGRDIPTFAVQSGQCNAYGPIWINGDLPTTQGEEVTLEGCASFLGDSCIRQYAIVVRNCGDFNAYCLPPTSDSYDRYCFGSESPCPEGQISGNGFTPCNEGAPAIDTRLASDPVIEVIPKYQPGISESVFPNFVLEFLTCDPYYEFTCNIQHDDVNAFFDIRWYADGALVEEHIEQDALPHAELPSTLTSMTLIQHGYKLGTTVTCRINARTSLNANADLGVAREVDFFAGVQVEAASQFIELIEGRPAGYYNATFSIPYRCFLTATNEAGQTCDTLWQEEVDQGGCRRLAIGMGRVDSDANSCATSSSVLIEIPNTSGCKVEIAEYSMSMKVNANPDHVLNPSKQWIIQPQVVDIERNQFWTGVSFPRATVRVNDTTAILSGKYCAVFDDPHQYSMDGNVWSEVQLTGAFLLYKHTHLPISVEVYFQTTRSGYTKNCGGAVRAGGEVFVFDDCRDDEPRRVTLYECDEGLQHMTVRERNSYQYEITLSTGTRVILGRYRQYVYPSIFDWEQTEGLCGNFNGIDSPEDDKIIRGTNTPDMGTPTRYGLSHDLFSNSYRIPENETLYFGHVHDDLQFDDVFFCDCSGDITDPGASCSSAPNVDCLAGDHIGASGNRHRCTYSRRRKRQAEQQQQSDDFDDTPLSMFSFDPDFVAQPRGWDEVWNEETARDSCEELFYGSSSAMACRDVPNINMNEAINSCIMDIFITGTTDNSRQHVNLFADLCQHEVEMYDFETDDEDVQLHISPDIARLIRSQVCPGDCSGHGQCVQGACVCDEDYAEVDCSIYMHHVPTLFALPSNGTCDKSSRPCELSVVFGDIFLQSSVHCKIQLRNVEGEALTDEVIVDAEYVHSQKIFCPISLEDFGDDFVSVGSYVIDTSMEDYDSGALAHNGSLNIDVSINNYEGDFSINVGDLGGQIVNMGPYIIDISVNNHDGDFSGMQQLYVYDGNCWDCIQGACMPLANKCHVGPTCYEDGDELNGTSCLICDGASGNFIVQADSCLIDGRCFGNGEVLSDTDCRICIADSGLAELPPNSCYLDGECFAGGERVNGSLCHECNGATGLVVQTTNTCFIGDVCYSDGETSRESECHICDGATGELVLNPNSCYLDGECFAGGERVNGSLCHECNGATGLVVQTTNTCFIGDVCYSDGEANRESECHICDGATGELMLNANSCYLDGECFAGGERVTGSLCHECNGATGLVVQTTNTCFIGDVCYSDGEANRESECHICDGATGELVLNSDFCYIDGMCFETGQANPANANEVCDASTDDSSWQIIGDCREYNFTYNRRRRFDFKVTKAENKLDLLPKHALLGSGRSLTMDMRLLEKAVVVIQFNEDTITSMTVRRFCMETTRVKKVTFEFFDIDGNKIKRGVKPRNYCLLEEEIPGIRKVKMSFKKKNGKDSVKISDLQMIACRN